MKFAAVLLMASTSQALRIMNEPDVFGPNGAGYKNDNASFDLSTIGVDIVKAGSDQQCTRGQWATVHWRGSLIDGRVVTDSRSEEGGLPKTFSVGRSQVLKCWDLVLPQLTKGTSATVTCPAKLAWGGAYTQAPIGGEPIPLNSDIIFDLDVLDCDRQPDPINEHLYDQPHTSTLQSDHCFFLYSKTAADLNIDQVLTTRAFNGTSRLQLAVEQRVVDDPDQQWFYYHNNGTLHNAAHPDMNVDFSHHQLFLSPHGG
mmetsp:Transcript_1608/g.2838  ORF Transcript_1608/g.2838 Transcript_1608/m.2838 type:complete len:257 (+) Transcript_1608:1-771(+)